MISNGVDTTNFNPAKDGAYLREKHGVKAGQKVLLCARRLVPKNGIEYIVRALPKIRETHDCVLWLASPLIREYERLKAVAKELGVESFVTFLGSVDHHDLPFYFSAADVVVQPSIAEARGLPELITHKINGYLIDPFQDATYAVTDVHPDGVARLAEAVSTLLSDESLRQVLKKGAREFALTCSWPEIARQTLAVYQDAIEHFV